MGNKYGAITTEKKTFYPDEPVFLFRATDPLTVLTLGRYLDACILAGCSSEHIRQLQDHIQAIEQWQARNPLLVKSLPD